MLCTQAISVAVSGSYAYVTGQWSHSLVVVDISNPASPAVRGSVVSSTVLNGVREAGSCARGWRRARRACVRTVHHARTRGATAAEALALSLALMCCAHRL